jgi:hypothetical protein
VHAHLVQFQTEGITSANGLAKALMATGVATARGGTWTARGVLKVLARVGESSAGRQGNIAT